MSMPFIIEHNFHFSPVVTGYVALCSGVAILLGGILSKRLINKPFFSKAEHFGNAPTSHSIEYVLCGDASF